jgi:hypothetical protein
MQEGPFPLHRRGRLYSLPPTACAGRRWDDRHGAGVDELARGGVNHKFKMFKKINANNCKANISKQEYQFILLAIKSQSELTLTPTLDRPACGAM